MVSSVGGRCGWLAPNVLLSSLPVYAASAVMVVGLVYDDGITMVLLA